MGPVAVEVGDGDGVGVLVAGNGVVEGSAVGSEDWCKELEEKPKGDWSTNETATYTKNCIR